MEEELPRGGNGRSRSRMLKKAEAHRFAILIIYQGFTIFVRRIVTMMMMITIIGYLNTTFTLNFRAEERRRANDDPYYCGFSARWSQFIIA